MTAPRVVAPPYPPSSSDWPPEQGQWTYEDWLQLPADGFRYEVLDGVLYMTPPPAFGHQDAVTELAAQMRMHAKSRRLGIIVTSPVGVRLPGEPVPVQPDILFVSAQRRAIIGDDYVEGAPDLVVEVLSPSNWPYDRGEKFEAYRVAGVREYWIADYRARTIEVFVLEQSAYVLTGKFVSGDIARSSILEGFEIGVDEVFSR